MRVMMCLFTLLTVIGCVASTGKGVQAQAAATTDGEKLFERRCGGCHSMDKDKEGPRLRGVYGRKSGSVQGYDYSAGLKRAQFIWDDATLDKWLTNTDAAVAGNNMDFSVSKAEERTAIIAFLKSDAGR
jgi:cytochrome c